MNEHSPLSPASAVHEEFLVLAERARRGEVTESERTRLAEHVAACEACRKYVEQIQQEHAIMEAAIENVQRTCDFERIEQAITSRRWQDHIQDRFSLAFIIGFGVAGVVAWWFSAPEGTVTALLAFAGGMALYWLYRRRLVERWGELAEQCKKGDPAAYETFHRSARSYLGWQRIAVAALFIWMVVFSVVWLAQGRWLMGLWTAALAICIGASMAWEYRSSARKREDAFITGEIDSDEYWMGDHALRRGIRIARFLRLLRINRYLRRFRRGGSSSDPGKR